MVHGFPSEMTLIVDVYCVTIISFLLTKATRVTCTAPVKTVYRGGTVNLSCQGKMFDFLDNPRIREMGIFKRGQIDKTVAQYTVDGVIVQNEVPKTWKIVGSGIDEGNDQVNLTLTVTMGSVRPYDSGDYWCYITYDPNHTAEKMILKMKVLYDGLQIVDTARLQVLAAVFGILIVSLLLMVCLLILLPDTCDKVALGEDTTQIDSEPEWSWPKDLNLEREESSVRGGSARGSTSGSDHSSSSDSRSSSTNSQFSSS